MIANDKSIFTRPRTSSVLAERYSLRQIHFDADYKTYVVSTQALRKTYIMKTYIMNTYINTYIMKTYIMNTYINTYIMNTYINTYIMNTYIS